MRENEKEVGFHEKIMKNDVCVFIKSETSLWKEMCNSYSVYIYLNDYFFTVFIVSLPLRSFNLGPDFSFTSNKQNCVQHVTG